MDLSGKTVIVTGASSGIGLALSRLLAKEKLNLAVVARREDALKKLAEELKDSGSAVLPVPLCVTRKEDIQRACREIKSRFGQIDVAVLNAGLAYRCGIEPFDAEAGRKIFEVNVFGVIDFIGELLPDMRARGAGMIVGVSSLADSRGFPRNGFYSASKSAVTFILDALRVESKKHGIKVVTVKPGFVKTEMTAKNDFPMPFLLSPEKAASIILKGMKKEKKYIQFPFPMWASSKVIKFMPNFLYEPIAAKVKK
ncbi:MAG: SDR family NAD(P)-dependent oxidoreductase [Candidatus Aminicenantes bacterium]|nr:SDR family NAD(P)-dependent oxidoreductase [Candidatus Aminicenantes bacterium]